MKISIIGAGNVGGLAAMRLAEQNMGDILLVDIMEGLAKAKTLDLEDSCSLLKLSVNLEGTTDIKNIKGSDIVIITAGLSRRPGMSREELLIKNAKILKDICAGIRELKLEAIIIVVSNPVDILTYLVIQEMKLPLTKVFGIGANLDAARFSNLISKELKVPSADIDALVIGCHGETMLPLSRLTNIKGVSLNEFLDDKKIDELKSRTMERGAEIVSHLGSGSAYFAPSAAVANVVKAIVKDEKRLILLSAYLNGEYGINGICIGVPCRVGRNGIEKIIELDLNKNEKDALLESVESVRKQKSTIFIG